MTEPGRWRTLAVTATALMAMWALAGAAGLVGGGLSFGPEIDSRLPRQSLPLAGAALFVVVAVPMAAAAVLAWRSSPWASRAVAVAGVVLVGWVVVETVVIAEWYWLQPLCFAYGLGLAALGLAGARRPTPRRGHRG
ncbi:hypothetical protein [Actinokineospora bangkokensis]|uniref:Uncharacterized protein n=1 Tax=Actinokineospora bangkokensis TaxID=1193682 RepID=A0A1Q9LR19_9PSEU|nr:hypothetical protein [Actinokineospora bangkokensis]OLR94444.1 hypothetical protein BJP25_11865 [Actinokineospora bangkokensis]